MSNIDFKIESILNPEDGTLPFAYYEPKSEGKITWNCGYDAEQRITSVFCHKSDGHTERKISYISLEDAKFAKKQLEDAGWEKIKAPEINITYSDDKEEGEGMNRKERRELAKKIKSESKNNPF